MLDSIDIVHMNGRTYDPMIGRFAQADPVTEAPFSTQGWNRYAYVGNSPVNFTDPSGYCFMGCFWKGAFKAIGNLLRKFPIIGTIIKIAATAICVAVMGPGCGPVMAFITSAFVTGVQGGSLGQALKAGLIAAATAVAFNVAGGIVGDMPGGAALAGGDFSEGFGTTAHIFKIASHAGIGCLSAMAGGGKCGSAALAGAVGAAATPFIDTGNIIADSAVHGVVGGLASVAAGGSFAEGATTAAFGYLFNKLGEDAIRRMFGYNKGHHIVPHAVVQKHAGSMTDDAIEFFSKMTLGAGVVSMGIAGDPHKWGPDHIRYNGALDDRMERYMTRNGINQNNLMTLEHAEKFHQSVLNSRATAIKGFLDSISLFLTGQAGIANNRRLVRGGIKN